jgi:hypothetical protein
MEETQKKEITSFLVHFWYVLVIVVCIGACGGLWHRGNMAKSEAAKLQKQITLNASISETEAQLEAMLQRQKELYPVLQKTWKDLKIANDKLAKTQALLVLIKKDLVRKDVEKLSPEKLSALLNALGYSNKVVGEK